MNGVYVADFTGSFNPGNPQAKGAAGINAGLTQWLAAELKTKYPCATVDTSADLRELLSWDKQRELLSGETPAEQATTLENIAKNMGGKGTFVHGTYAVTGNQLDCCDLPFGGSQVTRILGCFANREAKTCWIVAPPRSWSWA